MTDSGTCAGANFHHMQASSAYRCPAGALDRAMAVLQRCAIRQFTDHRQARNPSRLRCRCPLKGRSMRSVRHHVPERLRQADALEVGRRE